MSQVNPYEPTVEVGSDPFDVQTTAQLATRGERFLGALIDGVLQIVLIVPIAIGIGLGLGFLMGEGLATEITAQVLGGLAGIGVFLLLNGYLLATQGRTIGKLVVKTQIVDRDTGALLPFGPLILKRYAWLWVLGMFPIINLVLLVNVLMIFRENRACLHDDVAHTKVIKTG